MQRRLSPVLLLAGLWLLLAGTARAADAPQVTRLANGFTIITVEDNRFPLVSMRLFVHTGSGYETPKQAGLSHLLEHMVFKSTARRPAGQVSSDIEAAGGAINASTGFDSTIFKIDLPAERWKLGLDVFNDMGDVQAALGAGQAAFPFLGRREDGGPGLGWGGEAKRAGRAFGNVVAGKTFHEKASLRYRPGSKATMACSAAAPRLTAAARWARKLLAREIFHIWTSPIGYF